MCNSGHTALLRSGPNRPSAEFVCPRNISCDFGLDSLTKTSVEIHTLQIKAGSNCFTRKALLKDPPYDRFLYVIFLVFADVVL